jgi:hypothetical protein
MSGSHDKTEKPPEQGGISRRGASLDASFIEALSLALSVSKLEVQKRISESQPEKVSRHARYKYVPSKQS